MNRRVCRRSQSFHASSAGKALTRAFLHSCLAEGVARRSLMPQFRLSESQSHDIANLLTSASKIDTPIITIPGTVACSSLLAAVRLVAAARHTAPRPAGRQGSDEDEVEVAQRETRSEGGDLHRARIGVAAGVAVQGAGTAVVDRTS